MFNIRKLAAALFARPARRPRPLGFEQLEAREVPAHYWWVGDQNSRFVNTVGPPGGGPTVPGANWVVTPTSAPPASLGARPWDPPGPGDDLHYVHAVSQSRPCVWARAAPRSTRSA
ncbi:MAG: hypothetical protein K2X82_25540 [Gemmataceae bacterium]|nr:hypothetical protein [Gemmataceae bacterium]